MITPAELTQYLAELRTAGVTGPVEIGGIKLVISPVVEKSDVPPVKRDAKKEYDMLLFAATEGIPDEVES